MWVCPMMANGRMFFSDISWIKGERIHSRHKKIRECAIKTIEPIKYSILSVILYIFVRRDFLSQILAFFEICFGRESSFIKNANW